MSNNKNEFWSTCCYTLSESDLINLTGGKTTECKVWDTVCAVSGVGSLFGPIASLVFGPTTVACAADLIFNFSGC